MKQKNRKLPKKTEKGQKCETNQKTKMKIKY